MFLSEASVRRPIAMSCLLIALALLGLNSARKIGLEVMPSVDIPYVTVNTIYPGAAPGQIETDIAKRIEDQVMTLDGLKHVTSTCMENMCQTMLEFELDVDVDIAATDVREKLDLVTADFPAGAEDPIILKYDVNSKAIVTLALTGNLSVEELFDYADNDLRDRISTIPGVADVTLVGGAEREVHVLLDREKLAARGLSSVDVVSAVQNGIGIIPMGRIQDRGTEYSLKFDADYSDIERLGDLEVANDGGRRCYLRDVGRVVMTTEEVREVADIDDRACIAIKVVKKSDANAVAVVDKVRDSLADLDEELPGGMELIWFVDDGLFTRAMNSSAWSNVGQGILLTALILFFFLYNFRALTVVCITMPLTIVIGLFFMQWMGFTLNISTLLAVGMSVGILVTNSIVVIESIIKHLDAGETPRDAARKGTSESFIAVLASAMTNVVVLFPIAVMPTMMGKFMRPFALTMVIVTLVSLFICFTLTPILCAALLRPREERKNGLLAKMQRRWDAGFDRIAGVYGRILMFFERHRSAAILLVVVTACLLLNSCHIAGGLGTSMISESDRGEVYVKLEFPTRYDLARTRARVVEAQQLLQDLPELQHRLTTVGKVEGQIGQSSEGVHLVQIHLKFSERTERSATIDELMDDLRSRFSDFPEAVVSVARPGIVGGQSSEVELEIMGPELNVLDGLALRAQEFAGEIDGFRDVDTSVRVGKPEIRVTPRRAVLSDLGIPATGLGMALRGNLEGITAGTFKRDARNYDIVVKLEGQEGHQQVEQFLLPGLPGHPVSLGVLGELEYATAPVQILRRDKQRATKLYANLGKELPLGVAVTKLSQAIDEKGNLPPSYDYEFTGNYERMAESQGGMGEAAMIALVLVILTLSAILESFRQTWLILLTLPLAIVGMMWALWLGGYSISIFVLMGGVMLIGIVVNNAILMMDQFNVHVAEGMHRHKAMVAAATERLRPIVMITIAAVLGMLPLALSRGIGAEMRNDIGVSSAGGILVSGILTLFVIPIVYDLFTRRNGKLKEKKG